jgi:hypothetical protein
VWAAADHKYCEIPFADEGPSSAERIAEEDVAEVIKRAEDEAFALLKANWPIVECVTNALCRQDRLTTAEIDALIVCGIASLLGPAPTR